MIKLVVSGALGRMGQRIISLGEADGGFTLVGALERKDHPQLGEKTAGVEVTSDPECIGLCDCIIEFTSPEATIAHLDYTVAKNKAIVIGTTGLNQTQAVYIRQASEKIPIVCAPNMSVGVNLLFRLLGDAAKILKGYSVSVSEAHHIHKKDAPSGTAKKIAEIINAQGFDIKIENIEAVREDEIVGDHRIVFESDVDKIELFHHAKTRDIFVQGALVAAKWIVGKPAGLYSMSDVLFGAET
ncbi:MAG: 4-hydroxy-tetrahydrodipicolinate reductase [Candidatus Omnitrophica bacterium]|nr:4-hydroxy-tetrahydrodipicolinate reductase [Candidatus Omnitrophota bacterium]